MSKLNLTMLSDFYEFTMSNGYLLSELHNKTAYYDVFFRSVPDQGGFAIAAGLEQVITYIEGLHFTNEDMEFLRAKGIFHESFLHYLADFRFSGDIYAVPEGTPIFPGEPILTVRAKAIEAQLVETYLLMAINHQSLIATKANRIVRAARGRVVLEFGARRAHGIGGVEGARAAYIGGCDGTSNVLTDKLYGVPSGGTMAHSWIQMFESEYEAFKVYCSIYPENATLLVDTYNTIKSGVPNAIRVFKEILIPQGVRDFAIRLDSGDLAYLSKKARAMLDDAGLTNCKIVASNALDEYLIRELVQQGAKIDIFGVGERLITSGSSPVFNGVYKLAAVEDENGRIYPKIKISENSSKITNPHFKKVWRLFDRKTGKAIADQIGLYDEIIDDNAQLTIFDPIEPWKRKTLKDFTAKELQIPIFISGKKVYHSPPLDRIKAYCLEQTEHLWEEVKRFENPHKYYVDLSERLYRLKNDMVNKAKADRSQEK